MDSPPRASAEEFQRELDRVAHKSVSSLLSVFLALYLSLAAFSVVLSELPEARGTVVIVCLMLGSSAALAVLRVSVRRYALAPSRSHYYIAAVALLSVVTTSARLFIAEDLSLTMGVMVMSVLWGFFALGPRLLLAIHALQISAWVVAALTIQAPLIVTVRFGVPFAVALGVAHAMQRLRLRAIRTSLEQRLALTRALADVQASRDDESVARAAAERTSREKSAALAHVSHELRTPLRAIVDVARHLQRSRMTAEQLSGVQRVRDAGEELLRLIDDLLDLSRIEAGKLELASVPFSPRAVVDSVRGLLRAEAQAKGIELSSTVDPELAEHVAGDPTRVRQVLLNLVGNAIKFTDRGHVSVDVALARVGDEHVDVRFEVTDSGIGIAPEQQGALFDAYVQAEGDTARRYGGTGLGLAICKKLTELMGGEIGVESELGRGSTFWFQLPMPHAEVEAAAAVAHGPGRGGASSSSPSMSSSSGMSDRRAALGRPLSILVAEDHAMNRRVIERLLTSLGHRVTLVVNGARAQAEVESQRFDCVLMDVEMPIIDGATAARRIKALQRSLPIIAMSSRASDEERERCLSAGMSEYLRKPLDRERVVEVLSALR